MEEREQELIRVWELNIYTAASLNMRSVHRLQEHLRARRADRRIEGPHPEDPDARVHPRRDPPDIVPLVGTFMRPKRAPRRAGTAPPSRATATTSPSSSSAPPADRTTVTESTVWLTHRGARHSPPAGMRNDPSCTDEAVSRWLSIMGFAETQDTSLPTVIPEAVQDNAATAIELMGAGARGLMLRNADERSRTPRTRTVASNPRPTDAAASTSTPARAGSGTGNPLTVGDDTVEVEVDEDDDDDDSSLYIHPFRARRHDSGLCHSGRVSLSR